MIAARYRVNNFGKHDESDTFGWEELSDFLDFADTRYVLNLEVGQTYRDMNGDVWERIA